MPLLLFGRKCIDSYGAGAGASQLLFPSAVLGTCVHSAFTARLTSAEESSRLPRTRNSLWLRRWRQRSVGAVHKHIRAGVSLPRVCSGQHLQRRLECLHRWHSLCELALPQSGVHRHSYQAAIIFRAWLSPGENATVLRGEGAPEWIGG